MSEKVVSKMSPSILLYKTGKSSRQNLSEWSVVHLLYYLCSFLFNCSSLF